MPVNNFCLGYATRCITPKENVPLGGYGNSNFRISTEVLDDIFTAAIAISDGDNTVILIQNDLQAAVRRVLEAVRKEVSRRTGVPFENIMASVEHVHSAPDLWNYDHPAIERYTPELIQAMADNAVAAWENRKPVTVTAGAAEVSDLSFVRHYITESGHVRGPNFGLQYDSPKVAHTHEPDRMMQVVRFAQEGGEDIVLVNWQAHPQRATGDHRYSITADTIGVMRKYVEAHTGCKFIYALGASGDVQSVSLLKEENIYPDYVTHGNALGQAVVRILEENMAPLSLGPVKVRENIYTATIDKSELHKLEAAEAIVEQWSKDNDFKAAVKAGEPHGINSPYHARAIIMRSERPDTKPVELYAFVLGQLGFVFAPYEMFTQHGAYIKANSPCKHTIVFSMTNDTNHYIPTKAGFDYNCYEANTCLLPRGIGEIFADEFVTMLSQLSEE